MAMTGILEFIKARELDVEVAKRRTDPTRMTPEYIQQARRDLAALGEPSVPLARALMWALAYMTAHAALNERDAAEWKAGLDALAAWAQDGKRKGIDENDSS